MQTFHGFGLVHAGILHEFLSRFNSREAHVGEQEVTGIDLRSPREPKFSRAFVAQTVSNSQRCLSDQIAQSRYFCFLHKMHNRELLHLSTYSLYC